MKDLENSTLQCYKCNSWMKPAIITFREGVKMRGWRCGNCKEEALHPLDAQRYLKLNKLRHGMQVKVGEIKESPYVRFPKEFSDIIHPGDMAIVSLKAPDEISVKFKHPHPSHT
ncbi:MAG: hypothetical protein AABX01_00080 [Candidatus Micrarchaeota archaeon]